VYFGGVDPDEEIPESDIAAGLCLRSDYNKLFDDKVSFSRLLTLFKDSLLSI
jgi:hypothetical protein